MSPHKKSKNYKSQSWNNDYEANDSTFSKNKYNFHNNHRHQKSNQWHYNENSEYKNYRQNHPSSRQKLPHKSKQNREYSSINTSNFYDNSKGRSKSGTETYRWFKEPYDYYNEKKTATNHYKSPKITSNNISFNTEELITSTSYNDKVRKSVQHNKCEDLGQSFTMERKKESYFLDTTPSNNDKVKKCDKINYKKDLVVKWPKESINNNLNATTKLPKITKIKASTSAKSFIKKNDDQDFSTEPEEDGVKCYSIEDIKNDPSFIDNKKEINDCNFPDSVITAMMVKLEPSLPCGQIMEDGSSRNVHQDQNLTADNSFLVNFCDSALTQSADSVVNVRDSTPYLFSTSKIEITTPVAKPSSDSIENDIPLTYSLIPGQNRMTHSSDFIDSETMNRAPSLTQALSNSSISIENQSMQSEISDNVEYNSNDSDRNSKDLNENLVLPNNASTNKLASTVLTDKKDNQTCPNESELDDGSKTTASSHNDCRSLPSSTGTQYSQDGLLLLSPSTEFEIVDTQNLNNSVSSQHSVDCFGDSQCPSVMHDTETAHKGDLQPIKPSHMNKSPLMKLFSQSSNQSVEKGVTSQESVGAYQDSIQKNEGSSEKQLRSSPPGSLDLDLTYFTSYECDTSIGSTIYENTNDTIGSVMSDYLDVNVDSPVTSTQYSQEQDLNNFPIPQVSPVLKRRKKLQNGSLSFTKGKKISSKKNNNLIMKEAIVRMSPLTEEQIRLVSIPVCKPIAQKLNLTLTYSPSAKISKKSANNSDNALQLSNSDPVIATEENHSSTGNEQWNDQSNDRIKKSSNAGPELFEKHTSCILFGGQNNSVIDLLNIKVEKTQESVQEVVNSVNISDKEEETVLKKSDLVPALNIKKCPSATKKRSLEVEASINFDGQNNHIIDSLTEGAEKIREEIQEVDSTKNSNKEVLVNKVRKGDLFPALNIEKCPSPTKKRPLEIEASINFDGQNNSVIDPLIEDAKKIREKIEEIDSTKKNVKEVVNKVKKSALVPALNTKKSSHESSINFDKITPKMRAKIESYEKNVQFCIREMSSFFHNKKKLYIADPSKNKMQFEIELWDKDQMPEPEQFFFCLGGKTKLKHSSFKIKKETVIKSYDNPTAPDDNPTETIKQSPITPKNTIEVKQKQRNSKKKPYCIGVSNASSSSMPVAPCSTSLKVEKLSPISKYYKFPNAKKSDKSVSQVHEITSVKKTIESSAPESEHWWAKFCQGTNKHIDKILESKQLENEEVTFIKDNSKPASLNSKRKRKLVNFTLGTNDDDQEPSYDLNKEVFKNLQYERITKRKKSKKKRLEDYLESDNDEPFLPPESTAQQTLKKSKKDTIKIIDAVVVKKKKKKHHDKTYTPSLTADVDSRKPLTPPYAFKNRPKISKHILFNTNEPKESLEF